MRVLVATVVHEPRDARVYAREITALLQAGHEVTYIAPFSDFGVTPPEGIHTIDIPAARGRHRIAGIRGARRALRRTAGDHDVVLLHCPELLMSAWDLRHPCIIWDVHEDTAAAVSMKPWVPRLLRSPVAWGVRRAEAWAERHWHLILAEEAYAERFDRAHPVVPNSTPVPVAVPPPGSERIVYVGHVTRARGGLVMLDVARKLSEQSTGVALHIIGHADAELTPLLLSAQARGDLMWHGYLPNAEALAVIRGAVAGVSLLRDEANYRHSRPTKIMEYWAQGLPVISTPLPLARSMINDAGGGLVVPFDDADAVVQAVRALAEDASRRRTLADAGRAWVTTHADWNVDGPGFVELLRAWATSEVVEQHPPDPA